MNDEEKLFALVMAVLANPAQVSNSAEHTAYRAVKVAQATLAELKKVTP